MSDTLQRLQLQIAGYLEQAMPSITKVERAVASREDLIVEHMIKVVFLALNDSLPYGNNRRNWTNSLVVHLTKCRGVNTGDNEGNGRVKKPLASQGVVLGEFMGAFKSIDYMESNYATWQRGVVLQGLQQF
jgi:hypothetical protein